MRRSLTVFCMVAASSVAHAGGLMTNTNYHIAFDRMFARGATTEIDAAYSNPAGLAWGNEGLQLSLNFQKPWQNRDIETDYPLLLQMYGGTPHKFEGKASAPIVPALFASYKKDRWVLSSMIGIVGSGGFVKYDEGVPMFNVMLGSMFAARGIMPEQYKLSSQMKGKQYIYGGQLNVTYKIADCLSAAVGVRANYYDGYYRGHVVADQHPLLGDLAALRLDVDQKGWGFAPIVSVDFHQGPLTIGAKYEFRTRICTENKTNQLAAGLGDKLQATLAASDPATLQTIATTLAVKTKPYQDGVETRYDMPSLLAVAAQYEITPRLRAAVEYHFFDDTHAKMAGDRQKELDHGTHEFLVGAEFDVNDRMTLSCGGQRTDYGLSDTYQQNTSFACDSYSLGLGGAFKLNEKMRLNVSYFCTLYSDYTVCTPAGDPAKGQGYLGTGAAGSDTYSRTNHVIGLGLDYRF